MGLSQDLTCRSYGWWSKEPKTQNMDIQPVNMYSDSHQCTTYCRGIPEGSAVLGSAPCVPGATALSSRGETSPLKGDATQLPQLTLRMAEVAAAHPCFQTTPGNQHGKTEAERREGGSTPQKDKPDAPPAGAGTPGRNSQGKAGLRGALALLALWPSGSDAGSCLLFTDTEPLVELF